MHTGEKSKILNSQLLKNVILAAVMDQNQDMMQDHAQCVEEEDK